MWNAGLSKPPVRKWSWKALPKVTLPSVRAVPRSEMPGPQHSPFWQSEACFGLTPKGCQMFIPDRVRKQRPFHPRTLCGPCLDALCKGRAAWMLAGSQGCWAGTVPPPPGYGNFACQRCPAPQHGPNSEGESHPWIPSLPQGRSQILPPPKVLTR